ncbi:MAG: alkylhydroperoxidase [Bradyrhizobium sp.]|nr:alkylhydroperoxidase [Bradyrhizobium sp.]
MSRIPIPTRDGAPIEAKPVLDDVHQRLGVVPNLYRLASLSPNVLAGFEALSDSLRSVLDPKTRSRIALAVAQVNGCEYCLATHTYFGVNYAHISPEEIMRNRRGSSADRKAAAAVWFAMRVVEKAGRIGDDELKAVRIAGWTDPEIVEIVAFAAQNVFTNFTNNVAQTDVDYPLVSVLEAA